MIIHAFKPMGENTRLRSLTLITPEETELSGVNVYCVVEIKDLACLELSKTIKSTQ